MNWNQQNESRFQRLDDVQCVMFVTNGFGKRHMEERDRERERRKEKMCIKTIMIDDPILFPQLTMCVETIQDGAWDCVLRLFLLLL